MNEQAGGPRYDVPTGRLDGKVSVKEEALNLPSPAFPVEQSRESFLEKGLDAEDMVALLGKVNKEEDAVPQGVEVLPCLDKYNDAIKTC